MALRFTQQRGYVLHRGPSPIDGKPIIVLMTTKSVNRKTGNMLQTYILRDDLDPLSAIASADDYSVCGNCRHRKQADGTRSCYVNIGQSVMSVWRLIRRLADTSLV